jgi:acetyl esterase
MPIDPAIAAFLARPAAPEPASLADLRVQTDIALKSMQGPLEEVDRILDLARDETAAAPPVPIRAYWPVGIDEKRERPAIVFAHAGGWCLGSLDAYDNPCRALANATGCIVFSVGYRLAPEHPFPVPLEDFYQGLCWVAANVSNLAVDRKRIVVAGDSAGGNLAAAAALLARDRKGPDIAHQLLFYPALDTDFGTASYVRFAEGYYLTRETMRFCWETYLGASSDPLSTYAVPSHAHLAGLPSATIFVCEYDPLRSEGEDYARKLETEGIPVNLILLEGMIHACLNMSGLTQAARSVFARAGIELRRIFSILA